MATNLSTLPNAVQKRDLLWRRGSSDKELAATAQKLEQAGWLSDAVDFYGQNKSSSDLERLQKTFVATGDVFLYLKTLRWLGDEALRESDLKECSQKAESLGKTRYAIRGWERLGDMAQVERLRATIAEDGDIVAELQSKTFIAENLEEIEN